MHPKVAQGIVSGLLKKGRTNQISRREFMQGMMATGMTVASASSLWSTEVVAQEPKKGGHFRIGKGHGGTTDTLDPGHHENGFTIAMVQGVNNYLTEIDANTEVKAELAESWEATPDAAEWTFKLRQGVTFHNGKDVTAEDVVASINHHRGEATQSAAKPILAGITDIKADGKHTVVVTLDGGNADFPFIVSDYHIPIKPANEDGTMDWQSGVGCGAYAMKKFDPGVRVDLEKNPNYWKSDRGHFDSIEMLAITDPASRTNALVSGEADAIDRVDLKTVSLLGRKPGVVIHEVLGTQHYTFPMDTRQAPFDNVDVRRALKYAINREEIVQKVLQGYGNIGNDHPISPSTQFFAEGLEQTPYDPEKAKEHLKKAGMDSLSVDFHVADAAFAGAVDAAVLYAEHAKPAGININVVREPNDGYWGNVWMKKPFVASYWSGRPTIDWMFATAYASGVPWNESYFEHERFNELLIAARAELDEAKRGEMYFEMQKIMQEEGGSVVPMFASYLFATNDKVGYAEPFASNWDNDGERSMERWWFKS